MPPWPEWLDYFGADAIGRLIGLWLRFLLFLVKALFYPFRYLSRTLGSKNLEFHQSRFRPASGEKVRISAK